MNTNKIKEYEYLYDNVKDRTTLAYIDLLNAMRIEYEELKNEKCCMNVCRELVELLVNNNYEREGVDLLLLATYDTMARLGDFRAYCIALEWNRPREKQFFLPRKRILEKHGLIQAMQDVADDLLDFLFVSQSPRTGKNLSNSTPILTKDGWKTHGELRVGDYVLNDKGRFVRVLATSQEYPCNCRVTFANGEQIDCHENHEWVVINKTNNTQHIMETKELIKQSPKNFMTIPRIDNKFVEQPSVDFLHIEHIENCEMGKCIQVEGGIYLAGKTLIPTHNSTLGIFFLTFMAGRYPERSILANGHSTSLAQSFYNEFLNIITGEEYRYKSIFPNVKLVNQNAEYLYIDLNSKKRFHTITVKSLSGGTTGLAEASNILYCDDLIKDIEEANNPDRLDKIFHLYTSTIQDRTVMRMSKDGQYHRCPEIHIATRWSLNDVIGRLIDIYGGENNPRVRIINIPCYDENGESNFMYDYGKGFTTEYYKQLQMSEDPVIFAAKYLGEPIERDGLVFTENTLSYYNELPDREPDRIVAYADPSHGGDDYFSLPIGYVYDNEIYIEDIWFENKFGGDDYSRPKVCNMVIKHKVQRLGIERNNGGDFYSTLIEQDLKKLNYRCNITTHNAPTNKSKQDRILAYQNEIKGIAVGDNSYRVYFKSKEARKKNKQYNEAMQQLFKWNQSRRMQNKQHDDFPDSLAGMLSNIINGKTTTIKTIDASGYL